MLTGVVLAALLGPPGAAATVTPTLSSGVLTVTSDGADAIQLDCDHTPVAPPDKVEVVRR